MVFKGLMGGGAQVNTTLATPQVYPGGAIQGTVQVQGGRVDLDVNFIEIALTAVVEVESQDSEYDSTVVFNRQKICGPFRLQSGTNVPVPFQFSVPWEAPFNVIAGTPLRGVRLGVRTELDIARSMDKGDVDPIQIYALPVHDQIVMGLSQIGFRVKGSDLERGRLQGSSLPFYQEVEFVPPGHLRGQLAELEMKFVTLPDRVDVVLELDRRSWTGNSTDKANRFSIDHATAQRQDWAAVFQDYIPRLIEATRGWGSGRGVTPNLSGGGGYAAQPAAPQYQAPAQPAAPQYGGAPAAQPFAAPPAAPQYGGAPAAPQYGQPPAAPQYGAAPAAPQYGQPPAAPQYGQPPAAPQYGAAPTAAPSSGLNFGKGGGTANLTKGKTANLSSSSPGLGSVILGVGWDAPGSFDLDAAALLLDGNGRPLSEQHFVFFNNLASPNGAVRHGGEGNEGGSGDDEQIFVDLNALEPAVATVKVVVTIHDAEQNGRTFSQVSNAFIRVVNQADGREITRYDVSADAGNATTVVLGELQRAGREWHFKALGEQQPGGLSGFVSRYGLA